VSTTKPSNKKPIWLIDAYPKKRVILRSCTAASAPQSSEPSAEKVTNGNQIWLNSRRPVFKRRRNVTKTATFTGKTKNAITGMGLPS
jgi:hypothetical protein